MEISTASPVSRAAPATPQPPSAISSDFDTFLRMLTAQITNQDPLDPMKAEDFAVQLATFSGVEQAVRTNDLLVALSAQISESGFGQLAAWVGMEASATMPVQFDGTPVTVAPPIPIAGERHELVALDATGAEVWRGPVDPSRGNVTWSGLDPATGAPMPWGLHEFRLESFTDDRLVASEAARPYGAVQEVRYGPQGIVLLMAGGVEVFADSVSGLRNPAAPSRPGAT